MTKRYRVIQWSTGQLGQHAIKGILAHPSLDLVGLWVHSKSNENRDAGELIGQPPTGIVSTRDVEKLLSLNADCVCYMATDSNREEEVVEDFCRILRSGTNVSSPSLIPLIYPPMVPEWMSRLEAACQEGGSTLHVSGVNPGLTLDALPLLLSTGCERIDSIVLQSIFDLSTDYAEPVVTSALGQGKTPQELDRDTSSLAIIKKFWAPLLLLVAHELGVEFDGEPLPSRKYYFTDKPIETVSGRIEAGTASAAHYTLAGAVGGNPFVTFEEYIRFGPGDDFLPQDWPEGHGHRVILKGIPDIRMNIIFGNENGSTPLRDALISAAMRPVNLIPAICEAPPGVHLASALGFAVGGLKQ
jgi:hypothetical protein